MTHRFYLTEESGEKCQWCRDNIGKDNDGWHWEIDHDSFFNEEAGYKKTNVYLYIDSVVDAAAFKLRWI